MKAWIDLKSVMLSEINQSEKDNKIKNKKQPELPENQTIWKSNNQGDKEETFIQTGNKTRDGQPGRTGLMARWWLEDWVVPHLCADKPGGTTEEQDRLGNPGFHYREIKPPNL